MFEYRITIDHVIDGDTFDATVDLGFHTYSKQRFRLAGYSAPETRGAERGIGQIAMRRLEELLPAGSTWTIRSEKTEKFGRWLADLTWTDGRGLSALLIEEGYGLPWSGEGERPAFDLSNYPRPVAPARG